MTVKILSYEADDCVNVNMTSLQGKVTTTYDALVSKFGEPTRTDADPREKVACEWTVEAKVYDPDNDETPDDYTYLPFTVYCWKEGRIPLEECDWHIGGHNWEAYDVASDIING
tara:strand:- start:459 stop:800 length:342 start_codon:yes stop_codon:yes gene_type:complete